MGKQVAQVRYFGEKNKNNFPSGLRKVDLTTGEVFKNYYPITLLYIQGAPENKFNLNYGENSIIIGNSGVYELELNGIMDITNIVFNDVKVDTENPLIINLIYEDHLV